MEAEKALICTLTFPSWMTMLAHTLLSTLNAGFEKSLICSCEKYWFQNSELLLDINRMENLKSTMAILCFPFFKVSVDALTLKTSSLPLLPLLYSWALLKESLCSSKTVIYDLFWFLHTLQLWLTFLHIGSYFGR